MDDREMKDGAPVAPVQQVAQQAARQETAARPVRGYRTLLFQIYLLVALGIFATLAFLASTSAYFPIDLTVTRTLQILRQAPVALLMEAVSWPGYTFQAAVLIAVIAAALYYFGLHWEALMVLLISVGEQALNLLVKTVIHRPRPGADLVHVFNNLGSYSFPSGHVMFYTAFFGFLFFLAYTLLKSSWKRTIVLILSGAMVVLIGLSRIYLGEHWASDVIAAYLAGSLVLIAAIRIYRWGKPRFFARQPVAPEPPAKPV